MPNYIPLADAKSALRDANRVLVIGCSGAGKTTLSLNIADAFDLDYQSIDRDVRWLPEWKVRDRDEQRRILLRLVAQDRWVMDGSGESTFDIRVPRADLIVWVRVPRIVALLGVIGRVMRNFGKVRVAMAEGCPEPIPDREFLSYIWNFEREFAPKFVKQIDRYGPSVPVVTLRSRGDFSRLVDRKLTVAGSH